MISRLETLGDRLLAMVVPRVPAAAATTQNCQRQFCAICTNDGRNWYRCYKTCCDNPGRPPTCGVCRCPC